MKMGYVGNKRKLRQKFMKFIREMNNSIANDAAWLGRFEAAPVDIQYHHFEDNSGTELFVTLCFHDKETGLTKFIFETATWLCNFGRLWLAMNNFIVEEVGTSAWKNGNTPIDYRKVKVDWNKEAHKRWNDFAYFQIH